MDGIASYGTGPGSLGPRPTTSSASGFGSGSVVPSWDLELPPSPQSAKGKRPAGTSLKDILPTPSAGVHFAEGADRAGNPKPGTLGAPSPYAAPSPFSPTKRLKAMTLRSESLNPDIKPQKSKRRNSGEVLSTLSHRIQQAKHLYNVHQEMEATLGSSTGKGAVRLAMNKPLSFEAVLRKEFPTASATDIEVMLEAVEETEKERERRQTIAAASWSAEERKQVDTLFQAIDIDESGSISRDEFVEIAALCHLDRAALGQAFDRTIVGARRRSARTPGGSRELTREGFLKLIQEMDQEMLQAVRRVLPHLVPPGKGPTLLVFDDGVQQLWRLVPGGRALTRKPSPGAEATTTEALVAAKEKANKLLRG